MEFFGREEELRELRKVREVARKHARFTVVTGRRRVGKTELLKKAFGDGKTPCLYLLVTRKTEKVQCAAFQQEVEKVLGIRIPGKCERFKEVFEEILASSAVILLSVISTGSLSKRHPIRAWAAGGIARERTRLISCVMMSSQASLFFTKSRLIPGELT